MKKKTHIKTKSIHKDMAFQKRIIFITFYIIDNEFDNLWVCRTFYAVNDPFIMAGKTSY